jgi:molybdate transport system substrate-binding protein
VRDAGLAVDDLVVQYAVGRLALAWRDGLDPIGDVEALTRGDVARLAIANPGHAPYGRTAQEALESVGIWADVQPALVFGENVRQTTDYVEQGNADAGLVALSLVIGTDTPYVVVDAALHQPITQAGVAISGSGAEAESTCLLNYLRGPDGQALLARYGFEPFDGD